MFKPTALLIALLVAGLATRVQSNEELSERWDRVQALQTAGSTDTSAYRQRLQTELRSGDDKAILRGLRQLAQAPDLPAPAREKLLYDYVTGLRQEPPSAVSREVMAFLQGYRSTVLVEDEDHPRGLVPLYNISSTAAGVRNEWQRQEASYLGALRLDQGPKTLVSAYLDAVEPPERAGLIDALSNANRAQLDAVTELAMSQITRHAEAFALAANAALQAKNLGALQQLVSQFENPEMAHLLQRSATVLNRQQSSKLLEAALASGSAINASLAVAILSPALAGDPRTEAMLVEKLADPDLGSTAAIALARTASAQTLLELRNLAKPENQTAQASRARMALHIRETQLNPEAGQ